MITARGIACEQCGTITKDDILNHKSNWWFFGDTTGQARVEMLSFGSLNLSIAVPRQLEFCSLKCARAYVESALQLKVDHEENDRMWHYHHQSQEELA